MRDWLKIDPQMPVGQSDDSKALYLVAGDARTQCAVEYCLLAKVTVFFIFF